MVSFGLQAQQASQKGWIEADFNIGCTGLTVTIMHTGINTDDFQFNFEGDPNDPFSGNFPGQTNGNSGTISIGETRTYTYNTPGEFVIRVLDQSNSGTPAVRFDLLPVSVLDQVTPSVNASTCANNQIQLVFDFTADPFESYDIDYGDGSPIENFVKPANTNTGTTSYTYGASNNYNITVSGVLPSGGNSGSCNSTTINLTTQQTIETPVLNTIALVDNSSITFEYNTLSNGNLYFLEIDRGSGFEPFIDIDINTNPTDITVQDASIDNQANFYRFRIRATDICLSTEEFSQVGATISSSFALNSISNTIDIDYQWSTSPVDFTQIDFFVDNQLITNFTLPESTAPYTVSYNNCNEILPFFFQTVTNGIVSTSLLTTPFENSTLPLPATDPPQAELTGGRITLSLPIPDFSLGEYQILRRDLSPAFNQIATTTSLSFIDTTIPQGTEEACYQIRYLDECGNASGVSSEVCVTIEAKLRIPNAFSPNGDNINDIFTVTEGIYNNFQMLIYNRWGKLLFQTNSPSIGWNGTYEGTDAPIGSYTYRITFQNADNTFSQRSGTFTLIR